MTATEVARAFGQLAVTFFDNTLDAQDGDGVKFHQYLEQSQNVIA